MAGRRTSDFAYIETPTAPSSCTTSRGRSAPRIRSSCAAGRRTPGTVEPCGDWPRSCARSAPDHRADARLALIVQPPSGPIIRPASGHGRRPTRKQVARRRAVAALGLVAVGLPRLAGLAVRWRRVDDDGWRTPESGGGSGAAATVARRCRRARQPHQARHLHGQGEPDLQQLLRDLPGSRGNHDGRDADLYGRGLHARAGLQADTAPDIQPHDITHGFSSGLYAINGGADERLQHHRFGRGHVRLRLPRPIEHPELLGVRRPLRAGRPLLHVDVRPHVPRAPVHGGRAGQRHRRQQEHHRSRRAATATTPPSSRRTSATTSPTPRRRRSCTTRSTTRTTSRT